LWLRDHISRRPTGLNPGRFPAGRSGWAACLVATFAGIAAGEPEVGKVSGDAVIRAPAGGSEIVITTTSRVAGAIDSLTWDGREFIDSHDHGRQMQSASNLDLGGGFFNECFNPTEAGSMHDGAGPTSTSRLLWISASGRDLATVSRTDTVYPVLDFFFPAPPAADDDDDAAAAACILGLGSSFSQQKNLHLLMFGHDQYLLPWLGPPFVVLSTGCLGSAQSQFIAPSRQGARRRCR
jgi:hypothetical protein